MKLFADTGPFFALQRPSYQAAVEKIQSVMSKRFSAQDDESNRLLYILEKNA